jgi:hypothetical protein
MPQSELVKLIILIDINDDLIIGLLERHATDCSSKYRRVTDIYEEKFQAFINAWDKGGNSPVDLNENSDLTRAYHDFFACRKKEVIKISDDKP